MSVNNGVDRHVKRSTYGVRGLTCHTNLSPQGTRSTALKGFNTQYKH